MANPRIPDFLKGKECCFRRKQHNFQSSCPSLLEGTLIPSKALCPFKKARDVTAQLGIRSRFALRLAEQSGLRQCGLRSAGKEVYGYN